MEKFVRGEIVIVPFPFSNLSAAKKRSALVLFALPGGDVVSCQVKSKDKKFNQVKGLIVNPLDGSL